MRSTGLVLDALGASRPYTQTQPLRVAELELDAPGPGELLIRIAAAGICHSDLSVIDGSRPRPVPMALGHEAAGVVESVGPGVLDVSPGDHVVLTFVPSCGTCAACGGGMPALCEPGALANTEGRMLGGGYRLHEDGAPVHHHLGVSAFATHAVVARGSAVVIRHDVPLRIAALFGCALLTGIGAVLSAARCEPGQSLAVFGLGGIGLAAVMGGAIAAATPVIAVDPNPSKQELALRLGATLAVSPEDAPAAVAELAPGGVARAVEAAGQRAALEAAYALTARGGTTVTVGLPDPSVETSLSVAGMVGQARTVVGSYLGSAAPQRDVPRFIELWRAGRLPVEELVAGSCELDEANRAFEDLAAGRVIRQVIEPVAA